MKMLMSIEVIEHQLQTIKIYWIGMMTKMKLLYSEEKDKKNILMQQLMKYLMKQQFHQ